MKRLTEAMARIVRGLYAAVSRFPLTVICLGCATILICYMISLDQEPDLMVQKLMFTFLLGSFMGVAAQFACERFERMAKLRLVIYIFSALLATGYYFILLPAPSISFEVQIRTLVAVFAMFCAFIWLPSYDGKYDFNKITLIHFKSAFTSVLYSGVLAGGCAAIIAAIDTLLFQVNNDAYGYMMTIVWVLFAPIYYLSLLPRFNSPAESDRELAERAEQYPAFLEILVSYIAIPLVAAYTLVLAAYFIKILVTLKWPSGQLGIMVLAYSAAGLIIYILASHLKNRFAGWYRMLFPKVLIPVVIMQLISVAIRLNAYGVTESRYYVAIFGIFSLICGAWLSFKPVSKNGVIAVLAAGIAIFTVIPPVDAFTVSRVSQITRLESLLTKEGILVDGQIKPKSEVSMELRTESTSILSYLEYRKYTKSIKWLPNDFKTADNMKSTLGFEPDYAEATAKNLFASVDMQQPFGITGYDMCMNINLDRYSDTNTSYDFTVRGVKYKLVFARVSPREVKVSVNDTKGAELVGTGLYDFAKSIPVIENRPKDELSPESMTFSVESNGYKLKIMLQNVNIIYGPESESGVDYSVLVMFGAP